MTSTMELRTTDVTSLDVHAVLNALETFIKQRSGLDVRDYGTPLWGRGYNGRMVPTDALRAYRAEVRSISKDRRDALNALEVARALPENGDALADAFRRAFSGRLEWNTGPAVTDVAYTCPCGLYVHATRRKYKQIHGTGCPYAGRLEYCTGQYFPTEYRKAARAVLECYIADVRRISAANSPRAYVYTNITDVRAANRDAGGHWFDRSSMRSFNSVIESRLIGGKYFVTSERMDTERRKEYSVRVAMPDGDVETVGSFGQYGTRADAMSEARELARTDRMNAAMKQAEGMAARS